MTMLRHKIALSVIAFSISIGQAVAAEKDEYPYLDFGAFSSKGQTSKNNSKTGRKAKKKKEKEDLPTWQQAFKELAIAPEEQSAEVVETPATVRTSVEPVKSPIASASYIFDFAIEPYQPAGLMKIAGFQPYDLSSLDMRPMPSLAFRWLPLRLENEAVFFSYGLYASGAYVQHPLDLVTPTGESFRNTVLSTLKWQSGAVGVFRRHMDSPWGGRIEIGLGELKLIQSSSSSVANHSASETFASLGIFGERRIWSSITAFLGYDHRIPMGPGATEIELSRSNFKFGISGGFN